MRMEEKFMKNKNLQNYTLITPQEKQIKRRKAS